MASISCDPGGRKRILFSAGDGSRKTIRLGKCGNHDADGVCRHVEALAAASMNGQPLARETSVWVRGIGHKLYDRLAAVGLLAKREGGDTVKLGAFIDAYISQRGDVKPGTMLVFRQARRWLVAFLGEGRHLATVTMADADAYRAHLLAKKPGRITVKRDGEEKTIARATVAKWCQYARHYFEVAKRRKLIDENPFGHIRGGVRGNVARRAFIKGSDIERVIEAASDPQWKLLIALARWGGLRIPSEALALRWRDVNWEGERFTVHASKTEHHEGGGVRIVPIFPELRPHFQRVFDEAEPGTEFVISRYRDPAAILRTQLGRYIEAAGLTAWPKPWQNLRSSRATELADTFPSHVCATWLGHTEAVADEFYRQVTDDHFKRAIATPVAMAGKAAQNPAQQPPVLARNASHAQGGDMRKCPEMRANASGCETMRTTLVGALGFEPRTKGL